MTEHNDRSPRDEPLKSFLRRPAGLALCAVLAISGVILLLDHRVHVLASAPLLLPLAACLLMHMFMHRGHGGHHKGKGDGEEP
jgi:hypothetical protein